MMCLMLKLQKCFFCAVIISLATFGMSYKNAYAGEKTRQSAISTTVCPCIYDEPFATVMAQIKNQVGDWKLRPLKSLENSDEDNWNSYEIFKLNLKRHTLRLKLTKQADSALLFCSWIQWSDDGSIYNQIGMGHHLYMNTVEAELAQNNCISQLSSRLPVTVKHGNTQRKILHTIASGQKAHRK